MKNQKGITLIALVITIIVLLILAGITIAMLSGPNGLLTKSGNAASKTNVAAAKEEIMLEFQKELQDYLEIKYTTNASTLETNKPTTAKLVAAVANKKHDCAITAETNGTILIKHPSDNTSKVQSVGTLTETNGTFSLTWVDTDLQS